VLALAAFLLFLLLFYWAGSWLIDYFFPHHPFDNQGMGM
jgi:hypothetical protein